MSTEDIVAGRELDALVAERVFGYTGVRVSAIDPPGCYSRDLALLPLEEAVHKMTGLTASRFRLKDRGLLRPGYHADLVLFDPSTIADVATFTDPTRPSIGIHGVWVNGVLSYTADGATGCRAGRFVRRAG